MKKLLVVFAVLALPASAIAKEPVKVTVCGADGCNSSKDGKDMLALARGGNMTGGPPSAGAPGYKVHLTFREGDRQIQAFTVWHVPSQRLIRAEDGTWMEMTAAGLAALKRLAGDLRPFDEDAVPLTAPAPRGALPPQTYNVAPAVRPDIPANSSGGGGTEWWLIAGLGAAVALLAAFAIRYGRRWTRPGTGEVSEA